VVIHHVYANRSNVGDWLAARGIQSLLRGQEIAEHFCDEPFVVDTLRALSQCGDDDLVVIGGGGLFMDYFTPFWEGVRDIDVQVPVCIWGVGYCELKHELTLPPQQLIEEVVRKSSVCVVRDELTRQRLVRCKLVAPVACPSLCVLGPPKGERQGILHVDNYTTVGVKAYEAMEMFGRQMADRLGCPYRKTNNRIPPGDERALKSVLTLYAESEFVLSSGLHGCVIGAAMGCKVLAVSADQKIDSFMRAAGLQRWVCDSEDLARLPQIWETLASQQQPLDFLERSRRRHCDVANRLTRGRSKDVCTSPFTVF
jgi:polysaccharide pyruvyl transferase WcaK-like protein